MILAVKLYTNRNVDVVAYSIGVPLARKAVLGGKFQFSSSHVNCKF